MTAPIRTRDRIEGLDALRGLAALAVLLHHDTHFYDVLYPGRAPLPFNLDAGHFGVELFFIISGFVIFMTLERKNSLYRFAVSRVARLYPAFLAAAAFTATMLYLHPLPPPLGAPSAGAILANLTMAPLLLNHTGIDLPYWTLTYELVFYVSIAAIFCLGLLGRIELVALLWLALDLVVLVSGRHLYHRLEILLLIRYANFFFIGIALYRIRTGQATRLTYWVLALCVGITLFGGGETAFYTPGPEYFLVTLGFTALVWLATRYPVRAAAIAPLLFLGRISYPLYLIHAALGFEIIRIVQQAGGSSLLGLALAVAGALAVATLINVFVETPGKRLINRALSPRRGFIPAVEEVVAVAGGGLPPEAAPPQP